MDKKLGLVQVKFDEIKSFLENETNKSLGNILFDTNNDYWEINNSSLGVKLLERNDILILIDDGENNKFGCYFPSTIKTIGKYNESENCFIYSLNKKKRYSIKTKKQGMCIHKVDDDKLITIGKEDIVIFKKEKKDQCYCKQSSFEYDIKNTLIGKEGKNNPFTLNRLVVFEMV